MRECEGECALQKPWNALCMCVCVCVCVRVCVCVHVDFCRCSTSLQRWMQGTVLGGAAAASQRREKTG